MQINGNVNKNTSYLKLLLILLQVDSYSYNTLA